MSVKKRASKFKSYIRRYEVVAFLTGFSVLVLELSGARLIAPFFGTSTYIWTAIIGVILGALAVGNIVGGRLADRMDPKATIGHLLLAGSVTILAVSLLQQDLLSFIATIGLDVRLAATASAVVLFAVPSLLIGMIYPCLAKLQVTSLATAGQSIGRLEAAGTLGSIAGTFTTGYVFIGYFSSRSIVIGVSLLLLFTALLAGLRNSGRPVITFTALTFLLLAAQTNPPGVLADIDTRYNRFQVSEILYNDQIVRALTSDNRGIQSAVSGLAPAQPVLTYVQRFYEIAEQAENSDKILVIGGGAFTFPYALTESFDESKVRQVDVVEIDEDLEQIAKDYFYYQPSSRTKTYSQDGRTFLNQNQGEYDIIYLDAFSSLSPPFQLTTKETVERVKANLGDDGLVVVNVISTYHDGRDAYLKAIVATYRQSFEFVSMHAADRQAPGADERKNFILTASNERAVVAKATEAMASELLYIEPGGLILTDNFAPIERLTY